MCLGILLSAVLCCALCAWADPVTLPAGDCQLFEDWNGRIFVAVTGGSENGVFELDETGSALKPVTGKPFQGAAVTRSGRLFVTRDGKVWTRDLRNGKAEVDVSAKFGGTVAGDGAVTVTGDGRVWVRGCERYRATDGSYAAVPSKGETTAAVLPLARDIAGNDWALGAVHSDAAKRRLLISPAQLRLPASSGPITLPTDAIPAWLAASVNHGLAPGDWRFVAADDRGHVWAATPDSLWVLHLQKAPYHRKGEPPPPPNTWHRVKDKAIAGSMVIQIKSLDQIRRIG